MKIRNLILLVMAVPFLLAPLPVHAATRYLPHQSDSFSYYETIDLGSGTGNYQGYTEHQTVTGTETMNTVYGNGTVLSNYSYSWTFSNSSGSSTSGNQVASFAWSSTTFRYTKGTDLYQPQTYLNPTVWFYMDNTTANGGSFQLLNTQMNVQSSSSSFQLPAENRYVYAIKSQGTGSGSRNDIYGQFSLTYTFTAYFDPVTGYVVGYKYVEQDTSPSQGFTWTENLAVTSTSYPLATAPTPLDILLYVEIIAAVVIVIVIAVAIYAIVRTRRKIPLHPPPLQRPPPTIDLTPQQQPSVQQIVIKEVVKVKCRYCGALIDSTVQACPFCGAPRT